MTLRVRLDHHYQIAPGWWNAIRWWIRRHVRFSTYLFYVAPLVGWPRVILREDQR